MANIPFTHLDITDGTSQVNKTNMQTLFDALRKVVAKANRGATEYLDADLVAGTIPTATGLAALAAGVDTTVANFKAAKAADADTVSGYGIGSMTVSSETNLNNFTKGGMYLTAVGGDMTNVPAALNAGAARLLVSVNGNGSSYAVQRIRVGNTSSVFEYVRYWDGTTWYEDGNGGQPPAPKPYLSDNNKPGTVIMSDYSTGNAITTPNYTGSWYWEVLTYNAVINGATRGISAHNTGIGNASANLRAKFYKIT